MSEKAKKMLKTTKRIVVATMMGLFSLFSVFTATLAWFMSNLSTPVSGMEVKVKVMDTSFSQMTVHRCDLSASTSSVLHFYSTPSYTISNTGAITTTAGIDMDNYSDLNQTQPVLLLFTLVENTYEDDIVITATSENENFVYQITAENISAFPFSSAVKFKSASYSTNDFPFTNVVVSDLTTNTSFVTINGGGSATYNDSIVPFQGTSHTVVKYVAIVLDYYSDAIQYIFGQNLGFETIAADNNNAIDFYCDWTLEI